MKTTLTLLIAFVVVSLAFIAFSYGHGDYLDPVEVSPDNYRLLLEDGNYRMLEMWLPAGTSDNEHSHPNEMVYFIAGGKVRIHLPDGNSVEREIPDGYAMKHEPWTHRVENIGETDIRAIIFERR